ncbi:hypothetical protein ECE50_005345 [Chitinophaga sp. Mgbs1]|uniref:Uncharacterized protein n=1 Tax=Chitinophaga solisilvae TaxID=1233460 RepID=A0A3S1AZM8_9BACT|nr:hypothetical protein [Chitinophaga solisilvae]
MFRFYRYLIYKIYSWGARRPNDTPVMNVILCLMAVHLFQLCLLLYILGKLVPAVNDIPLPGGVFAVVFAVCFILLHYFLFYNKERWAAYREEFQDETPKEARKGKIYVLAYLIGSTIGSILMFVLIDILFS